RKCEDCDGRPGKLADRGGCEPAQNRRPDRRDQSQVAFRAQNGNQAALRRILLLLGALLAGCGSSPPTPDWQLNASQALQAFQADYLKGDTAASERDFVRARSELARTGRADLVARAELVRCAVRVASLEFDDCPGFQSLRDGAGA